MASPPRGRRTPLPRLVRLRRRAPSGWLGTPQEDLTKEIAQQNLPATTWQYPNWSLKMKYTLEQLRSEADARDFVAMFRNWLVRTGRVNREPAA